MSLSAVIVAGIVAFVIGFLFHGPLFGKLWMKLANITPTGNEKFSDMVPQMLWNLLVNIITAFVLSGILWMASTSPVIGGMTWSKAAIFAVWVWLGFFVTSSSIEVIWMNKSFKLWLFEAVSSLVVIVSMALVITLW